MPHLSRASYSWKKYPAFLTAEESAVFPALASFIPEDSDKIRTAITSYREEVLVGPPGPIGAVLEVN